MKFVEPDKEQKKKISLKDNIRFKIKHRKRGNLKKEKKKICNTAYWLRSSDRH